MDISKFVAQKNLSILWFINAAILALIFIVFTILDRFDMQTAKGWERYSQNVIPISTLMLGTFYINNNKQQENKKVNILAPLAFAYQSISIIDLLDKSKIYLILIQGLLTYSLGLFFNKEA